MMFSEFRSRYPMGCLISEFVMVDRAEYIVRVLVVVDGVTLSAALGAAGSVEAAEEKARMRALEVLPLEWRGGLKTLNSEVGAGLVSGPVMGSTTGSFGKAKTTKTEAILPPNSESLTRSWELPQGGSSSAPVDDWLLETAGSFGGSANVLEIPPKVFERGEDEVVDSGFSATEPVEEKLSTLTDSSVSKSSKKEIHDELTRLIGKEIRRLGWSAQQGKEYLMQTFNKPSSKALDENELLSFHLYLQSLPEPEK
ncbi:MAG TPA: hypothetical protein V6D13_14555 [Halomicronema sp.]